MKDFLVQWKRGTIGEANVTIGEEHMTIGEEHVTHWAVDHHFTHAYDSRLLPAATVRASVLSTLANPAILHAHWTMSSIFRKRQERYGTMSADQIL